MCFVFNCSSVKKVKCSRTYVRPQQQAFSHTSHKNRSACQKVKDGCLTWKKRRKEQRRASVSHPKGCQTHCTMRVCLPAQTCVCVSSGDTYRHKIEKKWVKTGGRVKYRGPDARGQGFNVRACVCVRVRIHECVARALQLVFCY